MEQTKTQALFIDVLRAALKNEQANVLSERELSERDIENLYRLAKSHDLTHIISSSVNAAHITLSEELKNALEKQELLAVYRTQRLIFALKEIKECFDAMKIEYVPLKGSVIRDFYPEPSMRTSCDIDILVKENQLDTAINALKNIGYRLGDRNYHDVSMFSPADIHLELHFSLQENMDNLDKVLKSAWDFTTENEGYCRKFTNDFFAFYLFSHMAYHFISGGCGIRSLMDIWVMEHKMGISYTDATSLLKMAGIYRFAQEMNELANKCFTSGEYNLNDTLLKYVFAGGIYGSRQNRLAVHKAQNKKAFSYAIERIFPSFKMMAENYGILKKAPVLLPFCYIARLLRCLSKGKGKTELSDIYLINKVEKTDIEEIKNLRNRLEI